MQTREMSQETLLYTRPSASLIVGTSYDVDNEVRDDCGQFGRCFDELASVRRRDSRAYGRSSLCRDELASRERPAIYRQRPVS